MYKIASVASLLLAQLQYIHFLKFMVLEKSTVTISIPSFHWFFNLYNTGDTSIFVKNITLHVLSECLRSNATLTLVFDKETFTNKARSIQVYTRAKISTVVSYGESNLTCAKE